MDSKPIIQNGISFELNVSNSTAKIVYSPKVRGDIIIPRTIVYQNVEYKITVIDKKAFKNNKLLRSIRFSPNSSLISIKKSAFSHTKIKSLFIPSSVETLEEGWCKKACSLETVTISPNNRNFKHLDEEKKIIIGKSDKNSEIYDILVFSNRDIEKVTIPNYIKHIDCYSFAKCDDLRSIEIPENSKLQTIGKRAFEYSSLEHLNIPASLEKLEEGWSMLAPKLETVIISPNNRFFKYADDEQKIIIGKSDKTIDAYDVLVFANHDIEEAVIPDSITRIESDAFRNCRSLKKIEISENSQLKSIGANAFQRTAIKNLYIPSTVENIDDKWCSFTNSLINVTISPNNRFFKYADENHKVIIGKSDKNNDIFDVIVFACRDIRRVTIPDYIVHIASHAFEYCRFLHEFDISPNNQLRTIGNSSFSCTSLETFTIPKNVEKVGIATFKFCSKLERFMIESGSKLLSISNGMFGVCRVLEEIIIHDNCQLRSIGSGSIAFTSICQLSIPQSVETLEVGWCSYAKYFKELSFISNNKNFKFIDEKHQVIIGKSDTNVNEFDVLVFANRDVKTVKIPSNIKFIEKSAFLDCTNLDVIEIPENSELLSFNTMSFSNCSVSNIFIPSKFEYFEENWCQNSPKLKMLALSPNNRNFKYADEDHQIIIGKSDNNTDVFDVIVFANRDIVSVTIPSYIKYINACAFECCSNLEKVEFQDNSSLQSIGIYAFSQTKIKEITIPKNVKIIEEQAFSSCKKLRKFRVENGTKLNKIPKYLFYDCKNVDKIEFPDDSPIHIIEEKAFILSKISEVNIPQNVEYIQDNWIDYSEIKRVVISPKNHHFKYANDKHDMIVAKSDTKSEKFDTLIYLSSEAKSAIVPKDVSIFKVEFNEIKSLRSLEILGTSFSNESFRKCGNLLVISFPNIHYNEIDINSIYCFSYSASFFFSN